MVGDDASFPHISNYSTTFDQYGCVMYLDLII